VTTLAIAGYDISVFLHVTAVMVGFGTTFAEAITLPVALKFGKRHLPYVHRLGLTINKFFAIPAFVIVLATGIYQTSERYDFSEGWISATFALLIIIAVINAVYFIPSDRKLGALAERDIAAAGDAPDFEMSDEYTKKAQVQGIFGTATGIMLVAAVFLMVTKPF
jgi:uncharacterized membrane protein